MALRGFATLSAFKVFVNKFGLFIQHLETLSSDKTVKSSDQAKLNKTCKLIVYVCFFVDLLQPAAILSQAFQAEDIDAGTVSFAMSTVKK